MLIENELSNTNIYVPENGARRCPLTWYLFDSYLNTGSTGIIHGERSSSSEEVESSESCPDSATKGGCGFLKEVEVILRSRLDFFLDDAIEARSECVSEIVAVAAVTRYSDFAVTGDPAWEITASGGGAINVGFSSK